MGILFSFELKITFKNKEYFYGITKTETRDK